MPQWRCLLAVAVVALILISVRWGHGSLRSGHLQPGQGELVHKAQPTPSQPTAETPGISYIHEVNLQDLPDVLKAVPSEINEQYLQDLLRLGGASSGQPEQTTRTEKHTPPSESKSVAVLPSPEPVVPEASASPEALPEPGSGAQLPPADGKSTATEGSGAGGDPESKEGNPLHPDGPAVSASPAAPAPEKPTEDTGAAHPAPAELLDAPPRPPIEMIPELAPPVTLPPGGRPLPPSKLLSEASFREAARRASKGSGSVIVAVGDRGYIPMLVNQLVTNVLRFGTDNVLVVAMNAGACAELDQVALRHAALARFRNGIGAAPPAGPESPWAEQVALREFRARHPDSGAAPVPLQRSYECWEYPGGDDMAGGSYGTASFARMVNIKTEVVMATVSLGLDSLLVDGDIVFEHDALGALGLRDDRTPHLGSQAREGLPHVAIQDDDAGDRNSGFVLVRATPQGLNFLGEALRIPLSSSKPIRQQPAVNMALEKLAGAAAKKGQTGVTVNGKQLTVRVLDNRRFPCGKLYFEQRGKGQLQRRAFAWVRPCPFREQDRPVYGEVWGPQALPEQARGQAEVKAGLLREGRGGVFQTGYEGVTSDVDGVTSEEEAVRALAVPLGGRESSSSSPSGGSRRTDPAESDTRCPLVVHNNWVVGTEAKVYRFKEMRQWLVDSLPPAPAEPGSAAPPHKSIPQGMVRPIRLGEGGKGAPSLVTYSFQALGRAPATGTVWPPGSDGGYYSGSGRRYLELVGDDPGTSLQEQDRALQAAFALAAASGRAVILPEFRCNKCRASPGGDGGCSPPGDRTDTHPSEADLRHRSDPAPGYAPGLARALALAGAADAYQHAGAASDADGCSFMSHWYVKLLSEHAKQRQGGVEWRERMFRYSRLVHEGVRLPFKEGTTGRGAMAAPQEPMTALVPLPPGAGAAAAGEDGAPAWSRDRVQEEARAPNGGLRVFALPSAKDGGAGGAVDLAAASQLMLAGKEHGGLADETVVRMSMSVLANAGFSGDGAGAWTSGVFKKAPMRQY